MQTMNNIYRYMALLAFIAVICVSCQKDTSEWAPTDTKNVMIELSVSASELTRATPTDVEKTINSLHIYAFSGDKMAGYVSRTFTAPGTPFYMDLELPETGTHNVDFYAVANEGEMVGDDNAVVTLKDKMTKAELEAIRFTSLNTGNVLPMYAKQTEAINVDNISNATNTIEGHEGHFMLTQKIAFQLTRPIVKLSVYAAKTAGASNNPQISEVELLNEGTRQYNYLYPQSNDVLQAIPSRANNHMLQSTTVTITKEITNGTEAAKDPANYDEVSIGKYLFEVPFGSNAWNISSGHPNAAVLHVEYAAGGGHEIKHAYINLPKLQRNHHVKVCILINAEGQIEVNYDVADWDDHSMPGYHFEYPTHSYLRESIPTTPEEMTVPASGPATMKENTPFKGYFQMTKPATDAWAPTLLGLNGSNCEIRVFEQGTGNEVTQSNWPIPASDKWYRIEVWPLDGGKMPVDGEVDLAISYTATGLTESEFLLINGSSQSFYWPYSGTSAQDANYVIITMVN